MEELDYKKMFEELLKTSLDLSGKFIPKVNFGASMLDSEAISSYFEFELLLSKYR